jgi:hypothetical protein
MAKPDVLVDNHGSMFLVTPVSAIAKEWVDQHLSLEGWQWMGSSFGVEHRFVAPIVSGMKADGLKVA